MSKKIVFAVGLVALLAVSYHVWRAHRSRRDWNRVHPQVTQAVTEGTRLLEAARFDDALSAYQAVNRGPDMGWWLQARIRDAKHAQLTNEVLRLSEVYFAYFPFGEGAGSSELSAWAETANDYFRFKPGPVEDRDGLTWRQEQEALDLLKKLVRLFSESDRIETVPLINRMLEQYPRCLACAPAVLCAVSLVDRDESTLYESSLARMKQMASPRRARFLVLSSYAQQFRWRGRGNRNQVETALAVYEEAARLTDITFERQYCLASRGSIAASSEDELQRVLGRSLLQEYLNQVADSAASRDARERLIASYLLSQKPEEAMQVLREMRRRLGPRSELALGWFAVAQYFFELQQYARSLEILHSVVTNFPASDGAAYAGLGQAEVYKKIGDEPRMIAAYRQAMSFRTVDTFSSIMDASNTRNMAYEALGHYYLEQQAWWRAIWYLAAWEPTSWCGNCAMALRQERWRLIQTALRHAVPSAAMVNFVVIASGWLIHRAWNRNRQQRP